ncbi:MAG: DsbA family protein [Candidatus Gracilibacteria bacterium]
MFSKNNSQTVWVGLSFLAVGLMAGLLISNGGISENFGSANEEAVAAPDVNPDDLEVVDVNVDDDAVLGAADAPVTIVEFSDFQCPYCHTFYSESLPSIISDYVDTGKVKLVFRDFPLSGHPQANLAAQAAECVARTDTGVKNSEAYYAFHNWLFENLAMWSGNDDAMEVLITAAQDELGVDIRTCLENGEMADEVNADLTAGRGYGVGGTPSFFINGKKLVGAWPYETFQKVIESEL